MPDSREAGPIGTIGETSYERFKRLIDSLEYDCLQKDFMAHIIARFAERHDLELRDILQECYDEVLSD